MAKHAGGRPPKYTAVEEMEEKIEAYFAKCDARIVRMLVNQGNKKVLGDVPKPEPYTVQGLAVALDLTTKGLLDYEEKGKFCATIKKAKSRIEANKVTHMLDGDGYGAGYIFDLKNNHGWRDKQDVNITGDVNLHFDKEDAGL